ncbi:MAG: haloalkane dehalogenase, partial [Myxococcota bacterium]
MHRSNPALLLTISAAIAACSDDEGVETTEETAEDNGAMQACDAEPLVLTTDDGVEFVQTPDSCFEGLTGWSYAPQYLEIDGLRQAYVDEGPDDGPVVLLLHGQPTWSYLYRTMIPGLVDAGYRVIAMDHVGMGRSDKPTDIEYYSYLGHGDRLLRFIEGLDLRDINLFVQDWGSQIGLRVAGLNPELFARIAVGNGSLIVSPAGVEPFPPVENPNEVQDLEPIFAIIPDQQPAFYDGCERLIPELDFGAWIEYALTAAGFHASEVVEGLTWFDVSTDVEAAYDAPFPRREYMAGVRTFPSLVNEMPGQNDEAWAGLQAFERPFATVWGDNDPGQQGSCEVQNELILSIPGSVGMPHVRLPEASHFLQDDQGEEVARRLVDIFAADPVRFDLEARYCEVLLVRMDGNEAFAEVWGTQNISECTPATWEALDADAIASETGAVAAILNGPRLAAMSSGIIAGGPRGLERQSFGGLQMRFLATLLLDSDQSTERAPYTEADVGLG